MNLFAYKDLFESMRSNQQRFTKARSAFHADGRSWYRMQADDDARTAEVFIYDAIGFWGVEAETFVRELNDLDVDTIHLRINSPGGSVFDGSAIYNALIRHKASVITHIDGLAASMASIIALAGERVEMSANAFFMIHEPWGMTIGTAEDMRKQAEILDKLAANAVQLYAKKSGLSEADVVEAMAAETWYSATEAKEAGFIDVIVDAEDDEESMRASAGFDLSVFANAPQDLENSPRQKDLNERTLETLLRDAAGFSRTEAKQAVASFKARCQRDAGGESAGQRDAASEDEMQEVRSLVNRAISALSR